MGIDGGSVGAGWAHGKATLLGGHTVVHDSAAIAVPPVELTATASARHTD